MKQKLTQLIRQAALHLGLPETEFLVEHPSDISHGDYATNIAMVLAKQVGKTPRELAEAIRASILSHANSDIASIEIAGPGFLNIVLSPEFYAREIPDIVMHEKTWGNVPLYKGNKVLVEHSSPNLFKPFHVGHMMNNTIGEATVRMLRAAGAQVTTLSYPSDVSLGIAKAIWALQERGGNAALEAASTMAEKIDLLGQCYVEGTRAYEDKPEIVHGVRDLASQLYAGEGDAYQLYMACRAINLSYFETITTRLGSHFDGYIFESEAGAAGAHIVREHIGSIFTESEGAVVYIPSDEKLHTRVFLNRDGNPTYEAKDLGLLSIKFSSFSPDLSLFVTDHEQGPYFQVVSDAARKVNPEWQEKTIHLTHGRMSFKGQKMSSRLGGVPLASDMIDAVHEEVRERSPESDQSLQDAIAIAAIKFTILKSKAGQNINFDPDTSLSFEGDSGPYLQYTHARIQSVLEKGETAGIEPVYGAQPISDLERVLYRFPEIVAESVTEFSAHHIVGYLIDVARQFNSFYGSNQIVSDDKALSSHRLLLAAATAITLRRGLMMLGITAPEKM